MRFLVLLGRAMPIALSLWLIEVVAYAYGIMSVAIVCVALGAVCGLAITVKFRMTLKDAFESARLGMIVGFLGWCVIVAPAMSLIGYEDDTGPRKRREACIAAIRAAMKQAATDGRAPFDALSRPVESALAKLPDHPLDRPLSVAGLLPILDDPDPNVRAQVILALGRFESVSSTILPLLLQQFDAKEPRIRAAATVSLAGMRPWTTALRDRIFEMLTDEIAEVRSAAVTAVGKIAVFLGDGDLERLRGLELEEETKKGLEHLFPEK
ncbi:HEAT repeat domain-containing protein [Isosphaeraceae bacterium EP7]